MSKNFKNIRTLTAVAAFIAMSVVFSQFLSITFADRKFSFTFLVTATMGSVFNLPILILAQVLIDLIGNTLFSKGFPYYPLFLVPKIVSVFIYYYFFHNKEITWKNALIATLLVSIICNILLNGFAISSLMKTPYIPTLVSRAGTSTINLIQRAIMMPLLLPKLATIARRELLRIGAIDRIPYKEQ
ncbi:MAG: folate family ECF transporter S component [Tissierellia bacterium]|nr:folate family ECF transporter S component [Tissierellia bacterium]